MARPYTCTKCGEQFQRGQLKECPVCGASMRKRSRMRLREHKLDETPLPAPVQNAGLIFSDGIIGGITIVLKADGTYVISFPSGTVDNRMITCPGCHRKLFQNTNLHGTSRHRCPRCKADIVLYFA
ncbi:MAG: hypothetical protein A2W25_11890 [candidate division Zixibacteria bacterium RBG_16_53_22]|nr:MAG: hypothetical protein A2W25_11890 [candidate division Zixibacteria bacterium RBG_16_53_22]